MKIKRKYCRLHGWAPHADGECCRCKGVPGMTRTEKVKAFLRGFKLRQRTPSNTNARSFVNNRFT